MKKFFTLLCFLTISGYGYSQLFVDDFTYNVGDSLAAHGYVSFSGAGTNTISVVAPGLTFAGYAGSGIGNAVGLTNVGNDVHHPPIAPRTADSVYAFFMVNVSAAKSAGDYFAAFLPNNTSSFAGRVFIKSSGSGFVFGLSKASTPAPVYSTTELSFGTTYLVALKYSFKATRTDDEVSLFVMTGATPASEPTPTVGPLSSGSGINSVEKLAFRQGTASNAATLVIDGLRIDSVWSSAILPITLASFSANATLSSVILSWNTSSEINAGHFVIEKSTNAKDYATVGTVKASGNENGSSYEFSDELNKGVVYYRLKMVDKDGSFTYSKEVMVRGERSNNISVYPNPARDVMVISHGKSQAAANIEVFNTMGVRVLAAKSVAQTEKTSINVANLPAGNYILVVADGSQKSTINFVKH